MKRKRGLEEVLKESFSYSRNAYTDAEERSYLTASENRLLRIVHDRVLKDLMNEFGKELEERVEQ
jgi:hypothetical protein